MYLFTVFFIYIYFADAVKIFQLEIFKLFFFNLLLIFKHFLPCFFHQAFSSKLLPRSGIFYQVTSKIRHFLPSCIQDKAFCPSYFQDSLISCEILQDKTFSCMIFQDTCKNNALSFKILKVKSDRFLQKMNGSSTRDCFYKLNYESVK